MHVVILACHILQRDGFFFRFSQKNVFFFCEIYLHNLLKCIYYLTMRCEQYLNYILLISYGVPRFNNIQLIWNFTDASSSNEAVHLQQRLKSLSTELLTLRNRLHVGPAGTGGVTGNTIVNGVNNNTIGNGNSTGNTIHSSTTTVNNTTSSPVIPITNSNKFNNKVGFWGLEKKIVVW